MENTLAETDLNPDIPQEAAFQNREMFKSLVDGASEGIAFLKEDNTFVYCSPAMGRLLGVPEKELTGHKVEAFVDPLDAVAAKVLLETKPSGTHGELRLRRTDGNPIWVDVFVRNLRLSGLETGKLIEWHDITEKCLAQEALRQSREFYTGLVESIDGIIWEADGVTRTHTYVSKKAVSLLGYPIEKWFGADYWNFLILEEDRQNVQDSWDKAIREKKGYTQDFRIKDAWNRKRWFRDYVSVVDQPQGPVKLRAVLVEISAQKAAERRQEMQLKVTHILALSASDEKAAHDLLSLLGHDWEWEFGVFWQLDHKTDSPHPLKYWRQPESGELPERGSPLAGEAPFSNLPLWIPDLESIPEGERTVWTRSALEKGFRSAFVFSILANGKIQARLEFFSRRPRRQDPDIIEMASTVANQISPFMERVRAEEALKESQDQLRHSQKMEAIGRLAGGVAHDFNNLLTAINGYSDLILAGLEPSSPIRSQVEEIHKAGLRAASLTNQLLVYSRRQVLTPQVVNLNTVISDMGKLLKRLIGEDIHLEMRLDPELKLVKIDPGQMGQVIMNLAVNSRDAMPTGGQLVLETANNKVTESPEDIRLNLPPGEYVRVSVLDNGRGMDESTKAHLFEPFFTTKEPGKGTGLGLSTVDGIIQQSGGGITMHSELGKGTSFNLYLRVEAEESESHPPSEIFSGKADARGRETILLVEDEDGVRNLAKEILVAQGYNVLAADGGPEALRLEAEYAGTIHLLLTDFIMEGMNGRQVYEALATRRPDIKVLFMSGYTEDAIARHGVATSAYAFLQKPFSPTALVHKVSRALSQLEDRA